MTHDLLKLKHNIFQAANDIKMTLWRKLKMKVQKKIKFFHLLRCSQSRLIEPAVPCQGQEVASSPSSQSLDTIGTAA